MAGRFRFAVLNMSWHFRRLKKGDLQIVLDRQAVSIGDLPYLGLGDLVRVVHGRVELTTADEMDDLKLRTGFERCCRPLRLPHDSAIQLNGQARRVEAERAEQAEDCLSCRNRPRLPVDNDADSFRRWICHGVLVSVEMRDLTPRFASHYIQVLGR